MVAPARIGARLVNDGTLYVYEPSTIDEGLDEYTQTNISFTRTNVFAKEFDEVTIATHAPSGGSIALNGTSQKIDITGTTDFEFGANDFTIEGWFYLNNNIPYTRLWCFPNGDNLEVNNSALYYWNGGASIVSSGNGVVPQGVWFNVAMVKHNGHLVVYMNGSSVISDSNPYVSTASRPLTIGGENSGDNSSVDNSSTAGWLNGNVTNFRIVKGAALYFDDFSTPYAPFNSIDNTVLLLNSADSGHLLTDSSAKNQTVTGTGTPTYSSSSPLSSVYNGAMKQLKNGTIQVGNEFDETTVLS